MTTALQNWTARLSDARFPILGRCAEELAGLLQKEDFKNKRLADVLSHDPLLCARVFRAANREPEGIIASIEQAAGLIGPTAFQSIATTGPLLEETLRGAALGAYLQSLRRAYLAAALTRHLAKAQGYSHPQEFFFAGLLYSVGDLALHAIEPKAAQTAAAGARALGGLDRQLPALSQGLANTWHLPELVHRALDETDDDDRKAVLVRLAVKLVDAGSRDLHAKAQEDLIEEAAISGELGVQFVLRDVYRCAVETTRHLLDWYPLDRRALTYTPIYPGPYEWPQPRTQPRPATAARAPARAQTPRPASPKPKTSSVRQVVEESLAAIQAKLGLKRVVFAGISRDRQFIRGQLFCGVGPDSPLRRFQFERAGPSLFAQLVEKPQHVWVHAGNREKLARFLNQEMHDVLGRVDFCASSVFVRSRPVGLCYADAHPDGQGLDEGTYSQFKGLCNLMARRLAETTG